jgi:hypothetical protein
MDAPQWQEEEEDDEDWDFVDSWLRRTKKSMVESCLENQ